MFQPGCEASGSVDPGWLEWEEPRHPGPASQSGTYPTLPHSATQISSFAPHDLNPRHLADQEIGALQGERAAGELRASCAREPARLGCSPLVCKRRCGVSDASRSLRGAAWETRGTAQPGEGSAAHAPCRLARRARPRRRARWPPAEAAPRPAEADPASAVPADAPFYLEAIVRPEGDLREDALAAAGKVLRTDDPSGKISRVPRQGAAGGRRHEARLREGHRAVARRACGRVVVATRPTRATTPRRRGDRRDRPTRRPRRPRSTRRARRAAASMTERSHAGVDYEVDEDGDAIGIDRGLPDRRRRGAVQAHARRARGRQVARRRRTATRSGTTASRTTASAHFYVDLRQLLKLGFEGESERRGAAAPVRAARAAREARPGDGLVRGRRRPARARRDDRASRARSRWARSATSTTGASTPLLEGAARRHVGRVRRAEVRRVDARVARPVRRRVRRRRAGEPAAPAATGSTSTTTSSAGSATSRSSCAATASRPLDGGAVIQVTDEARRRRGFGKLVGAACSPRPGSTRKPIKIEGADAAFAVRDGDDAEADRDRARQRQGRDRVRQRGRHRRALRVGQARRQRALRRRRRTCSATTSSPAFLVSMPAGRLARRLDRRAPTPRGTR